MANLKTEVDKLDIDKLVSVSVDLGKLSGIVKIMSLKRVSVCSCHVTYVYQIESTL